MRIVWSLAALLLLGGCVTQSGSYKLPEPPDVSSDTPSGTARTYYVDGSLDANPCTRYNPATRQCDGGRDLAFNNLSDANSMARSGDTLLVRQGVYEEQIRPTQSGTAAAPIIYRSAPGEQATLADVEAPALWLQDVQHVHVQGFLVRDVIGWARLEDAHHNQIRGNDFREAQARGTTGGFKVVRSHYNRITDNTFYRGNDSIVVQHSDRNLIQGNHFEFARHSLFSIRCGNFNILRGNFLHNERQKIGEIYDCEAISDAPYLLNATKRNLIEANHFAFSRGSDQPVRYPGIQFAGQLGLVRYNLFKNNEGGAVHYAVYPDEALYNYGNRVAFNWFFDNRCYAVAAIGGGGARVNDNRVVGNLYSGNVDCLGYRESVSRGMGVEFADNEESSAPTQGLPRVWPARTMAAGEGRVIDVDDVLFFYDGFGIAGERGDAIQIESTGASAEVTLIDYQNRLIHVDRELRWEADDGVRIESPAARKPFTVMPSRRVVREGS